MHYPTLLSHSILSAMQYIPKEAMVFMKLCTSL